MSPSKKPGSQSSKPAASSRTPKALGVRPKVILDSMVDAVITVNGTGEIRGWSEKAGELFGWSAPEVVGQNWIERLVAGHDRESSRRQFETWLLRTDQPEPPAGHWEILVLHKAGFEVPIEVRITIVRLGALALYCMFARDITAQKESEHAAQIYKALVTSSWDAIITETPEGVITSWNPGAERIYGYTAGEMIGQPITAIVPPELRAEEMAVLAQACEGKKVEAYETERVRKDGARIPILNTVSPIHGTDRRTIGVSAIGLDISGRRRAEMERDLFFAQSFDLLCLTTLDGTFIRLNASWERVLSYPVEELQGRALMEFVHQEDRVTTQGAIDRLARAELPTIAFENRCRCKDGSYRSLTWSAALARGDKTLLATARDVTEQRHLEEQFLQAQKMEAVGRLAGGVAHDFNNILTAILGYADILLQSLPPASGEREDVNEIHAAARRAAGLTRQLLAFSRQQVLQPAVLNVNEVVIDFQRMLGRLLGEDVELRTTLSPDIGNVLADAGQLEQVLMNLAVNARDAMPTGGKLGIETANTELSDEYVEAHHSTVAGPYVMLAVTDTGTGISPEIRDRIFEPFFTTKEQGKGTGLGLSTVYGIVRQSGGYIWVYSEPNRGTSFKIYLPRVAAAVQPLVATRLSLGTPGGTETILLAEDDGQLRKLISRFLGRGGYRVLAAAGAEEALTHAREHAGPIHLLLTDVVMPGESGRQLAGRLAELLPEVPVLYMSGYTDSAIVQHGILEPGLNYVQKPFTPADLARRVRDLLDRK